jgi:GntR family transcriptional regulator
MSSFRTIQPSPLPLHAQVRESLRERILDGTFPPHAQLPAESELGSIFGVSRITVRQALGDLQREGIVIKIPGKGSFVAKPKAYQQLTQLEGFAEAMSRLGHTIRNLVTSHKIVDATAQVAQRLQLAPGTPVSEIRRVRHLDREPVSLEVTYLPKDIGERLRHEDLQGRDIFLILENDYRIPLGHADLQIEAVSADDALAHALQVPAGTALLRLERLTHTEDGIPLDFEYLYIRGDAFQYRLRIARRRDDVPIYNRKNHADTHPDR